MERRVLLASKSPRRHELLRQLGVKFEVLNGDVDESFPPNLTPVEAVCFVAEKKAIAFQRAHSDLRPTDLILTADTVVVIDEEVVGKPRDAQEARDILQKLSGRTHQVITACAFAYQEQLESFHEVTDVVFRPLELEEIVHYIDTYRPYDKAGAYGIQEWIGMIGVTAIHGSYNNVVGLPTERVYSTLKKLGAIVSNDPRHDNESVNEA